MDRNDFRPDVECFRLMWGRLTLSHPQFQALLIVPQCIPSSLHYWSLLSRADENGSVVSHGVPRCHLTLWVFCHCGLFSGVGFADRYGGWCAGHGGVGVLKLALWMTSMKKTTVLLSCFSFWHRGDWGNLECEMFCSRVCFKEVMVWNSSALYALNTFGYQLRALNVWVCKLIFINGKSIRVRKCERGCFALNVCVLAVWHRVEITAWHWITCTVWFLCVGRFIYMRWQVD